jgi:hypothetical protein
VSAPMLRSQEIDLAAAKDILARLERYAASVRTAPRDPLPTPGAPVPKHPMAAPTAAPRDDILPVAVPWAYARRPDVRTTEVPQTESQVAAPRRRRINPATADLFPYDLGASIVACALTIMAYISFGRPVAVGVTVVLAIAGECMRRFRWFPSIGVKILIGTLAGLVLVFTA